MESITSHEVTSATVKFPQESVALKFPVFDREQMEQWLPEENLEQGSADYEELAANNGVVVTDAEDQAEMCIRDSGISVHPCTGPHGGEGIPHRSGALQRL